MCRRPLVRRITKLDAKENVLKGVITKTKTTALPPRKDALKLSDIGITLLSSNLPYNITKVNRVL